MWFQITTKQDESVIDSVKSLTTVENVRYYLVNRAKWVKFGCWRNDCKEVFMCCF